jgi:hypothetical protein
LIRFLLSPYDLVRRWIDVTILWPSCRDQTPDLDHAKAAFAVHAFRDRAWTRHFSEEEIFLIIDALV